MKMTLAQLDLLTFVAHREQTRYFLVGMMGKTYVVSRDNGTQSISRATFHALEKMGTIVQESKRDRTKRLRKSFAMLGYSASDALSRRYVLTQAGRCAAMAGNAVRGW